MTSAFILQHVHEADDGTEDVKFIGVYSSREAAQAAVKRLCRAPGFVETPEGFSIDEYQLDQDHWAEGYISAAVARSPSARG